MRAAIIDTDGLVVTVAIIGDEYDPDEGFSVVELDDDGSPVCVGWTYDGGDWIEPTPSEPEPEPPSLRQLVEELAEIAAGLQEQVTDQNDVINELINITLGG